MEGINTINTNNLLKVKKLKEHTQQKYTGSEKRVITLVILKNYSRHIKTSFIKIKTS